MSYPELIGLIPDSLRRFMSERYDKRYDGVVGVLATLTVDGDPNASPKHFRIRDDNHIEFTDLFSRTLGEVLNKAPRVSVVFFDPQAVIGFRLKGKARLETFGPLFNQVANRLENMGLKPKALVNIEIDEIQSLGFGSDTGKKIG